MGSHHFYAALHRAAHEENLYGRLDATRQIRATCATTQVIIFTFHNQDTCLLDVVQAGAAGFVLKSAADTELNTEEG